MSSLHSQIDSHILHEGYLSKKGKYNTSFQRRYFVLYDDRTTDYFKDKLASASRNKAKGTIHLTQIKRVELVQYEDKHSNCKNKNNSSNIIELDLPSDITQNDTYNIKKRVSFAAQPTSNIAYFTNNNNNVISSYQPPPDYNTNIAHSKIYSKTPTLSPTITPSHPMYNSNILESGSCWNSIGSECILSDNEETYEHKTVLSSKLSCISIDSTTTALTPRDEYDAFHLIKEDTKLGLKCDRKYSFALISNGRNYILSAENNNDLKEWITKFNKLCQGQQIYDGYLNNNKYFVLYKNKILNCYKNINEENIEFDIDLRHILYLKYDKNLRIEISVSNLKKAIILNAENAIIAKQWYNKILSLFNDQNKYNILLNQYDSCVEHINIIHNGQVLKNRWIAMYNQYIVIFNNENQFNLFKDMRFFSRTIFRDYTRKNRCILIPLNKNIKIRKASKKNGTHAFLVSNAEGDRKWYFNLKNKRTLYNWMNILCNDKNTNHRPKSKINYNYNNPTVGDLMIESTLSPSPTSPIKESPLEQQKLEENDTTFSFTDNTKVKVSKIKINTNTNIKLAPIFDDYPSNETFTTFSPDHHENQILLDDLENASKLSPILSNYKSNDSFGSNVSNISYDD